MVKVSKRLRNPPLVLKFDRSTSKNFKANKDLNIDNKQGLEHRQQNHINWNIKTFSLCHSHYRCHSEQSLESPLISRSNRAAYHVYEMNKQITLVA